MPTNATGVSNTEQLALVKLYGDKVSTVIRDSVKAGTYKIDCKLRLRGTLQVNPNYPVPAEKTVPPILVVQLMRAHPSLSFEKIVEKAAAMIEAGDGPDKDQVKVWQGEIEQLATPFFSGDTKQKRGNATFAGELVGLALPKSK